MKTDATPTLRSRLEATWKEYEGAVWFWLIALTVVVGVIALIDKMRGSELPGALGIAALAGILQLLGKPGFWYCVVALMCANSIARGLHDVARSIRLTRRHRRPRRVHEEDDDLDDLDA